jgi:4a-hydroxytetrahydrobiopterin dehydratase
MATKLSESEIEARSEDLVDWTREGDKIRKLFKFASFAGAIAFVTQVAFLAEAAGHHPDIDIRWRKVAVALSTHDAGGLTEKDFDLAAQIDEILG